LTVRGACVYVKFSTVVRQAQTRRAWVTLVIF